MKTPDEIKKALECCANDKCEECPYDASKCVCFEKDALEYIQQLEAKAGLVDQYRWERDVAIDQLEQLGIGFGEKVNGKLPRWISVDERLPEDDEWVLTYYGNSYGCIMAVLQWTGKAWLDEYRNEEMRNLITCWMPLPEPPTEE